MRRRAPRPALAGPFIAWTAAAALSRAGDAAMSFALGWAASGHGAAAAGAVVTAVVLPRTLLMLLGGAVGDRWSPRPVLLAGHGVLAAATGAALLAVLARGTPLALLVVLALVEGAVTAFTLPASASVVRGLVPEAQAPRALAVRQAAGQVADLAGGPLGGLLVAAGGFAAAAGANAMTFVVVLVVLGLVRTPGQAPAAAARGSLLRAAGEGVAVALASPVLRTGVLLTGVLAGLVLPVGPLLLPLLAREQGWAPQTAALVLGAQSGGALLTALAVARWGALPRTGAACLGALAVAGAGTGCLAASPSPGAAVASGAVVGVALSLFVGHAGPLVLTGAPPGCTTRLQAVLGVVQSAALTASTPLLGLGASRSGAQSVLAACAVLLLVASLLAASARAFRTASLPAG